MKRDFIIYIVFIMDCIVSKYNTALNIVDPSRISYEVILKIIYPYFQKLKQNDFFCYIDKNEQGTQTKIIFKTREDHIKENLVYLLKENINFKIQETYISEIADIKNLFIFSTVNKAIYTLNPDLMADFYVSTNNLFYYILKLMQNDEIKLSFTLLEIMIRHSIFSFNDIRRGVLSYYSHAHGYFQYWKDPEAIKNIFEARYQKSKDLILEIVLTQINVTKETLDKSIGFKWENLMESYLLNIKDLIKNNEITFPIQTQSKNFQNNTLENSQFHKEIINNKEFINYMNCDINFLTFRFSLICLYFFLKRFGFSNNQRYLLCYYIYRAVEDIFKINPIEMVKNFNIDNAKQKEK